MSFAGIAGSALTDFSGDPKFRTLHNVKSPAIASRETGLLSDYDATRGAGASALSDYISKFLAGTKDASDRVDEELTPINRLYGGGLASDLAALRGQRSVAMTDAATLGANLGLRRANQSVVGSDGSGGSYRDRLLSSITAPYYAQAAVDNADQARRDFGDVLNQQYALAGRRQAMSDTLAARGLVPQQARQSLYSQNAGNLSGITALDQANNFYGLQQKTTGAQRWGKFLQDMQGYHDKDMGTMMGAAGAGAQGGGGGGGMSY